MFCMTFMFGFMIYFKYITFAQNLPKQLKSMLYPCCNVKARTKVI